MSEELFTLIINSYEYKQSFMTGASPSKNGNPPQSPFSKGGGYSGFKKAIF